MKRILRWFLNGLTVLSLLLCVAIFLSTQFSSGPHRWLSLFPFGPTWHVPVGMPNPVWAAPLFAILPTVRLLIRLIPRRSAIPGHCLACGYDLRATPDRCPECGTLVSSNRAAL